MSSLLLSCLSFFIFSSLSFSVFFLCLCLRMLLWLLLCVVGVVSCALCLVSCVVWCGVTRWKRPPCVHSKRPRVCRHHAHMLKHMRAWCGYKRDIFDGHTGDKGGHRQFCSQKFAHARLSCALEVHHFEFLTTLTFRALHGHLASL